MYKYVRVIEEQLPAQIEKKDFGLDYLPNVYKYVRVIEEQLPAQIEKKDFGLNYLRFLYVNIFRANMHIRSPPPFEIKNTRPPSKK